MDSLWAHSLLLAAIWGIRNGQSSAQPIPEAVVKEGYSATLNCSYESGYPTMMWYKQALNKSPQFILHDSSKGDELEHRFTAQMDRAKRAFPLMISDARPADTATYYCVLRATVSHSHGMPMQNPLQAQKNTQVQEQPYDWGNSLEVPLMQQGITKRDIHCIQNNCHKIIANYTM